MARSTRDNRLETRTARLRLKVNVRHHRAISAGLALGYRRTASDIGSWHARFLIAPDKYVYRQLGKADDYCEADAVGTLTYFQAQENARALMAARNNTGRNVKPYTVGDAMADYLKWYAMHRKSLRTAQLNTDAHILPKLGTRQADQLTTPDLRKWHESLSVAPRRGRKKSMASPACVTALPIDPEFQRQRQQTANRILTILKAALNMAYRDELVISDGAWRRVKPFRAVNRARVRAISTPECVRLLNACSGAYRDLVKGALLTGCRYGELISLRVDDFISDAKSIYIRFSKSGASRHVPLTTEGEKFFWKMTLGKMNDKLIFTRDDGAGWRKNHQVRPLRLACQDAGIVPAITFHILRHTYASQLAMAGVPLQVIAKVLGHADTRITEQHYAHLQPSFVAEAVRAALPPLEMATIYVPPLTLPLMEIA